MPSPFSLEDHMTAQRTMVYRAAVDGDTHTLDVEGVNLAYQIVELDDTDPAPDGWFRTTNEISAAPVAPPAKRAKIRMKAEKSEPENDAANDETPVSDDGISN